MSGHRCQMCTEPGRARQHQGTVVYLCAKHWREVRQW